MMYIVYSYEIIDGDIDFIERIKEKGREEIIEKAFKLAYILDKEESEHRKKESLCSSIVHLVYDENDNRIGGYPGRATDRHTWENELKNKEAV